MPSMASGFAHQFEICRPTTRKRGALASSTGFKDHAAGFSIDAFMKREPVGHSRRHRCRTWV